MGENHKRASWNKMGYCSPENMEGFRGDQEEVLSIEKFGGYKTEVKEGPLPPDQVLSSSASGTAVYREVCRVQDRSKRNNRKNGRTSAKK